MKKPIDPLHYSSKKPSTKPESIIPIFLLSTPRAGSTLLQRIIARHSDIATTPEPYLLLPHVYAMKPDGLVAQYHQPHLVKGFNDFFEYLPNGRESYFEQVRKFILSMYSEASRGKSFFLDKTPYYDLIVEEVIALFPNAKFIFLFRNPLSAIASTVEMWGQGEWRLFLVHEAMTWGLVNLVDAAMKHHQNGLMVSYEKLVQEPVAQVRRITDYLEVDFEPAMIDSFTDIDFRGKMGDPTGSVQYDSVSRQPIEKWKKVMSGPLRKRWCRRFLETIGEDRLSFMGYDYQQLIEELNRIPAKYGTIFNDAKAMLRDELKIRMKQTMLSRVGSRM